MIDSPQLPEPGQLEAREAYERVVPGSATRIISLVEPRAAQEAWIEKTLAREARITRVLSYGSLALGIVGPMIGICALIAKLVQG